MLRNPEQARLIGDAARESVRKKFLTPRILGDYLSVIGEMVASTETAPILDGIPTDAQGTMVPGYVAGDS